MGNFFALPYETKLKLKRNAHNARGYFDDELTKRRRDWKEALDVGVPGSRDWSLDDTDVDGRNACLDGYNQFPTEEECPNFRKVVVEYFEACAKLSDKLAALMALSLNSNGGEWGEENEEEEFLQRLENDHTSYLRMNYYPPSTTTCTDATDKTMDDKANNNLHNNGFSNKKKANEDTLGISPHRDAGFLTILLQDDECHSLQVARFEDDDHIGDDKDRWVTVHPVPGSLTINTGDMAMICSNGRFRAPLHRVMCSHKKRYSAPFFYNPGYNELISPFDCCYNTKEATENQLPRLRYNPCLWGYFRALRFAGDLTDLGVEIQTSHFKTDEVNSDHIEKQEKFMKVVDFNEPFNVEKYRHILQSSD